MSGVTGAIIGGAVIAGGASIYAANKASSATSKAASQANTEQGREFDLAYQAQAPYRQIGDAALNQLAALYGLPQYQEPTDPNTVASYPYSPSGQYGMFVPGPNGRPIRIPGQVQPAPAGPAQPNLPNYAAFYNSPDYQFARDEGIRGVTQNAALAGGLKSGNALRGVTSFASGLATQNFNNYANRLAALAGIGQSSATNIGNQAITTGQGISANMLAAGNARASGIMNSASGVNNAIQGGLSNYLYYQRMQPQPYYGGGGNMYTSPDGYTTTW